MKSSFSSSERLREYVFYSFMLFGEKKRQRVLFLLVYCAVHYLFILHS
jgi:hypothetical protein